MVPEKEYQRGDVGNLHPVQSGGQGDLHLQVLSDGRISRSRSFVLQRTYFTLGRMDVCIDLCRGFQSIRTQRPYIARYQRSIRPFYCRYHRRRLNKTTIYCNEKPLLFASPVSGVRSDRSRGISFLPLMGIIIRLRGYNAGRYQKGQILMGGILSIRLRDI